MASSLNAPTSFGGGGDPGALPGSPGLLGVFGSSASSFGGTEIPSEPTQTSQTWSSFATFNAVPPTATTPTSLGTTSMGSLEASTLSSLPKNTSSARQTLTSQPNISPIISSPTSASTPGPTLSSTATSPADRKIKLALSIFFPLLALIIITTILVNWLHKLAKERRRAGDLEKTAVWMNPEAPGEKSVSSSMLESNVALGDMRIQVTQTTVVTRSESEGEEEEAAARAAGLQRVYGVSQAQTQCRPGLAESNWSEARSVRASRIGLAFGEKEDWNDGVGGELPKMPMPVLRDVGGLSQNDSRDSVIAKSVSMGKGKKIGNGSKDTLASGQSANSGSERAKRFVMIGHREMEAPEESSDVLVGRLACWIKARKGIEPIS